MQNRVKTVRAREVMELLAGRLATALPAALSSSKLPLASALLDTENSSRLFAALAATLEALHRESLEVENAPLINLGAAAALQHPGLTVIEHNGGATLPFLNTQVTLWSERSETAETQDCRDDVPVARCVANSPVCSSIADNQAFRSLDVFLGAPCGGFANRCV